MITVHKSVDEIPAPFAWRRLDSPCLYPILGARERLREVRAVGMQAVLIVLNQLGGQERGAGGEDGQLEVGDELEGVPGEVQGEGI